MARANSKATTPKPPQLKMNQEGAISNNGGGESSFRVLYYGSASAGSIPFIWESHPGTPKHPTTESSPLPQLTPPPAFHQLHKKHSTSLKTLFLSTSFRKTQPTSLRTLFLASSSRRAHAAAEEDGSSTVMRCFGGGFKKVNKMKKVTSALMSVGSHGKMHDN